MCLALTGENIKEYNSNSPQIPDHPCRTLIISGFGSRKSVLLKLISCQPGINKIYPYAKDPSEAKYQLLINKCVSIGLKHCNDSKAFIEHLSNRDDIHENKYYYNPRKVIKY